MNQPLTPAGTQPLPQTTMPSGTAPGVPHDRSYSLSPSHPSHIREVELSGQTLTVEQVVAVARYRARVSLASDAARRVQNCRTVIDFLVERGVKVYGLTTGFGSKRDIFIDPHETLRLQANLIQSHAAGVGEPLPEDVTRAAMLLRANTLARGNSGVRLSVLLSLLSLLNRDVYPYIPAKGSVGASGDLAPLSHLTLVLMGHPAGLVHRENEVPAAPATAAKPASAHTLENRRGAPYIAQPQRRDFVPADAAYLQARFGIDAVLLEAKEGLALNNGTQIMTAVGALTVFDGEGLLKNAEIICAASFEALKGVPRALDERIHRARPHVGQQQSAANLRALIEDSQILRTSLNTAMLRKSQRHLELALLYLRLSKTEWSESQQAVTLHALEALQALQQAPFQHIQQGIASLTPSQQAELSPTYLEHQGALAALQSLKAQLHDLSRALLDPALPPELLPTRDCLTGALAALEGAVPSRPRVQDDYSLRCTPQVLGSARDALSHAWRVLEVEFNAATDNPLIFPAPWIESFEGESEALKAGLNERECVESVFSGGNFHGEPIGMVMDYVKVAIAEVGSISERRIAHLVDGHHNQGLPSLLVERSGLNSGLMIPQYTAAALVSENKVLAHPATVDSIPTCENTEDHVSMGTIAARQAREILCNVELVLAIEALTAFQALHFRRPVEPGIGSQAFVTAMAENGLTFVEEDRVLYPDIERSCTLIRQEVLVAAVEGRLQRVLLGLT